MERPRINNAVHYVSYGTPGGEYPSVCRAAKVTEVDPADPNHVGLIVMNPTGLFFHSLADGGCHYHDGAENPGDPDCPHKAIHATHRYCSCSWIEAQHRGGTWHWPHNCEA